MWLYLNMSDQSPIAKSTDIVKESSYLESMINYCGAHQSTETYEISWDNNSWDLWMSYMEDSHARVSVVQDLEKAWKMSEADYFSRSCAFPKKSSPNSYSLKTCPLLPHEADFKSLEKLPKWGMIVDGVLLPLHPLEQDIKESDGSCWPTPQARAQTDTPSESRRHTPCLESAVMMVATPTASQAGKPIRNPSPNRINGSHGEDLQDSIGRLNPESIGKKLSIAFVEVLMGYPTKWTECDPLVMPWFLNKSKKRLKSQ